jgi:hypothetical protein
MEQESPSSAPADGQSIRLRTALLIGALAHVMERRQPRDRPEAVSLGSKARAVLDRANELALDGREDNGAVSELVSLADGKRRTLRRARHASRFGGFHREHRHANRVFRLLDAACSDGHVGPVEDQDSRRIDEVELMMALPRHERWELLAGREPRLLECESQVRSGAFGWLPGVNEQRFVKTGDFQIGPDGRKMFAARSVGAPYTEAEARALRETANNRTMLHRRIAQLLGPDSGQRDLLLGSTPAQQAAEAHLRRCQG